MEPGAPPPGEEPAAPPPSGSAFDDVQKGGGDYTRSQSLEAGQFALFLGGKRIPAKQAVGGAVGIVVLLIVVTSLISSGGGSDGGDTGAVGAGGYEATFSSICGRSAAAMGLEMAINAPFSQGDLPAGVSLNGDAWQDPDFGVMVDGEGDSICLGDTSAEGWSGDDDFTISFSFTKQACRIPGDYEFLFSSFGECTDDRSDRSKPRCTIADATAPGIHIFLGCDNDRTTPSSTIDTSDRGHSILRIIMTDDSLQRATFDVDLNLNRQSSGSASDWVHMALTVTKTSLQAYINGVKVPNDKIGYAQGSWWSWATHKDNLALGDPAELRGQLSSITLEGCAYLGSGHPKYSWAAGQGYSGSFAGVQLLKGAMAEADAMCLYQVAEGQSKSCPTFSSLFGDGLGRPWQNGALANGNVGPDLAYVQTPHQMVTDELMDGATRRAMDGPSVTLTPEQATPDNAVAACAEVCRTARRPGPDGYPFMGLQWNNMCFCGDTYDKEDGTGRLDVSECDSNGDMVPDCGQSMVGTDPNPNACVWRNAVFDLSTDQQPTCNALSENPCRSVARYTTAGYGREVCEAAGACVYTPEDSSIIIEAGSCKPTTYDYCTNVDLGSRWITTQCGEEPRPDWNIAGGCVYDTGSNHDPRRCWEGGHFDNDCRGNPRSVSCSDGPNGETFVRTLTDPNADAWGSADYTCTNPSVPEGTEPTCTSIVPPEACVASSPDQCATMPGCSWTPDVTQQESCVARDKEACDAVQVDSERDPEAACNAAGDDCVFQGSDTPRFRGCYQDSEGTGGSAIQLVGNTQANGDYGVTFDGDDDWAIITAEGAANYANDGVFSVCFYFTRQDCYSPNAWQTLYSHQGIGTYPRGGSLEVTRSWQLEVRDTIEMYLGCSSNGGSSSVDGDFIRILAGDHDGNKMAFDISSTAEMSGGYVTDTWAHLAVSFNGPGRSINSYVDGVQVTTFGTIPVRPDPAQDWAQSAANLAFSVQDGVANPMQLTAPMGGYSLAGGNHGPVLGNDRADRGQNEFIGSMTFVTLWTKAITQDEARCLFSAQNSHVQVCQRPREGRELPSTAWREDLTVDAIRSDVQLGFDAWFDPGYGLTLDGVDDFMAISPAPAFTNDGTFTISFWYTRTQCTIPGGYESLYSQRQSWITGEDAGARVDLAIGCNRRSQDNAVDGSEIGGTVISATLVDNDGQRASFDIPLTEERIAQEGGFVSDMWGHFVLAVSRTGVRTFLDGNEVAWHRYGFNDRSRDPLNNLAYPNPTQFQGDNALTGFTMQSAPPQPYGSEANPAPGLAYKGCWSDSSSHMWPTRPSVDMPSSDMTPTACATQCEAENYRYMGLSWGGYCFCGNTPPGAAGADGTAHPKESDDGPCSYSCRGDPTYACGGRWKVSAYEIQNANAVTEPDCDFLAPIHNYEGPELTYLGCYRDGDRNRNFYREPRRPGQDGYYGPPTPSPADGADNLETISTGDNVAGREAAEWDADNGNLVEPMHIELCARLCSEGGYQYMALFDGTNCYCENVPPEDKGASRDDELGCNDSCPADITQICGDGGRSRHSSVYRINSVPPPNACAGRTPPPAIVFGHSSGNTGLGMSGGFSGSIAQIQLFTRSLGTDEVECLFNFGQSEVKTCKAAVMLPGVQYFQTFLPPEVDYATDFSTKYWGQRPYGQPGGWEGFGTPNAFRTCTQACQRDGKQYAAMDFQSCYCANSLDSLNGRVDNNECAIPPGHCAWGESSCSDPIDLMPAINAESCGATDAGACREVMRNPGDGSSQPRAAACAAAGTAPGVCTYSPADPFDILSAAGCYSKNAEYCAEVNADPARMNNAAHPDWILGQCGQVPHPEWGIEGGCTYTAADPNNGVAASCTVTVPQEACDAGTFGGSEVCGAIEGCEWREQRTREEDCVARDKDVCVAVNDLPGLYGAADSLNMPPDPEPAAKGVCEGAGACTYTARRASSPMPGSVDRNRGDRACHVDEGQCGGCSGDSTNPSKWCRAEDSTPPPPPPVYAECGWRPLGDFIQARQRSQAGFDGWNGDQTPPACFQRYSVYQVGRMIGTRYISDRSVPGTQPNQPMSAYKGCYRSPDARPRGVLLRGGAFFDNSANSENIDSGWAGMSVGSGHSSVNDGARDMGIHFDGEGDYAVIDPTQGDGIPGGGRSGDYALDGTFTVSFWATQPDCNLHGREEWLFAHTKFANVFVGGTIDGVVNPAIAIAYLCTANGIHSTASPPAGRDSTHLIRTYLVDDDGQKAVFDIPLNGYSNPWHNSERNGDFITRSWVHIAIASNGTSVIPYIDGHRVPDAVLGVPPTNFVDLNAVSQEENAAWNARLGRTGGVDVHNMALGTFTLSAVTDLPAAAQTNDAIDESLADATGILSEGCFSGTARNFEGWTRDKSMFWNFNSPLSTLADKTSPTWGSNGDFPRYKGHGPNYRMSPQACATLCWDDTTDETCEPTNPSVDVDCSFDRGDPSSCGAGCTYAAGGDALPGAPHTNFVIGRDGRCTCGDLTLRSGAYQFRELQPVAPELCGSGCNGDGSLACGGRSVTAFGESQEYFSVYSFDSMVAADKPWERLPNPVGRITPMFLGGHQSFELGGDQSGAFVGNIADFGLFNRGIDDDEMDCLFRQTKRTLGGCQPMTAMRGLSVHAWASHCDDRPDSVHCIPGEFPRDDGIATLPLGQQMGGANTFADDGTFTLGFWFDKNWCDNAGQNSSSTLLAWGGGNNCGQGGSEGVCQASVSVQMVCPNSARPSSLQGAVLRVHLVSDNGNSYEVDVSARNELDRGLVMDNWASLTISARNDKVDLYVDNIVVQFRQRWGAPPPPGMGEMGFPAEYLNAGQRSPLACADGYQFQRADGRDGRPQDNACGAIGGCVNQVDVSGQVCGQQCNDQCRRQFDNPQNTNIAYPNPTRLDGRLDSYRSLPNAIQLGGVDISVPSTVTFTEGDQDPSKRYQGQIDGVMGFNRNLGDEDRRCVFKHGTVTVRA